MSSGSVLQVVIMQGGSLVGTEMLVPGDYRIGRSDECELHLDEPTLSRVHARLVFNGTRVGIQDLKSDNGVVINGEKVAAREVKSLDDVVLGKVTLKFKVIPRRDSQPPQSDADKPALGKTVPLAARPDAAELRAAAGMPQAALVSDAGPNPYASDGRAAAATSIDGPLPRVEGIALDPEVTSPGGPPGGGLTEFNSTQPSVRRGQVAPELAPPPPAPVPPRPVIGLVPPPPSTTTPAPTKGSPAVRPSLVPPPAKAPEPPPPAAKVQLAPPPPVEAPARSGKPPAPVPIPKVPSAQAKKGAKPAIERTIPKAARAELLNTTYADPAVEVLQPGQQPSLRVRVWWGDQMVVCHTFPFGIEIKAAESDQSQLPLFGFGLTKETVLARVHSSGWAVHVPKGVGAEIRAQRGWESMQPSVDSSGVGIVPIQPGTFARLTHGVMKVEFFALAPQVKLPPAPPKIELSLAIPFAGAVCAVAALIVFMPKNLDAPDFTPKALPALRAALVPPTPKEKPKPKEKEKEKPAEKREKEPPKQAKAVTPPKKQPPQQAPVAVAALAKLTSSPAMSNLLSATNKISGGGRPSGLKMVGLKGIGPVALAGSGPGTGGGFGGGAATGGRELLGSVAAIGLGHALKGSPGGTVQSPAKLTQIHGSMSREEIAKVVNAHYQQIRACYEKALLREPGLTGKLAIEWTIDTGGGVSQVKTKSSSMKSDEVVDCINDNVKTWRFPKPSGGEVVVSYPFIFNSAGF